MSARKKRSWMVASMRKDGTPAVWLTFTNWLLLNDGIVSKYLVERHAFGSRRARQEARNAFGPGWKSHPDLGRWALLDTWDPLFSHESNALELYRIGWAAYHTTHEKSTSNTLNPEQLVALGDKHERRGFEEEVKRLKERAKDLSCNAARAESVAAVASDQPKQILPGERSLAPEVVAANPGRALEVAGLGVAA